MIDLAQAGASIVVLLVGGAVALIVRARLRPGHGWPGAQGQGASLLTVAALVALSAAGLTLFVLIAEDVVSREPTELVLRLDRAAQRGARWMDAQPGVQAGARALSHVTGEGMLVLVPLGGLWLYRSGERRQALVFVAGIASAWALSGALKLAFAVPRPHAGATHHAITAYGFPSGHTLVVTVACGLVAWLAGPPGPATIASLRWLAAVLLAALTAAARVLLNAHWLSDVAGGVSAGMLWLGLVLLILEGQPLSVAGGRGAPSRPR